MVNFFERANVVWAFLHPVLALGGRKIIQTGWQSQNAISRFYRPPAGGCRSWITGVVRTFNRIGKKQLVSGVAMKLGAIHGVLFWMSDSLRPLLANSNLKRLAEFGQKRSLKVGEIICPDCPSRGLTSALVPTLSLTAAH